MQLLVSNKEESQVVVQQIKTSKNRMLSAGSSASYLIQFDEDARCRFMVVEVIFLSTREPVLNIHITYLIFIWRSVIITVIDVLTTTWGQTWLPVHCKQYIILSFHNFFKMVFTYKQFFLVGLSAQYKCSII